MITLDDILRIVLSYISERLHQKLSLDNIEPYIEIYPALGIVACKVSLKYNKFSPSLQVPGHITIDILTHSIITGPSADSLMSVWKRVEQIMKVFLPDYVAIQSRIADMPVEEHEQRTLFAVLDSAIRGQPRFADVYRHPMDETAEESIEACYAEIADKKAKEKLTFYPKEMETIRLLAKTISKYMFHEKVTESDVSSACRLYQGTLRVLYGFYQKPMIELTDPGEISVDSPEIRIFEGWRLAKEVMDIAVAQRDSRLVLSFIVLVSFTMYGWE